MSDAKEKQTKKFEKNLDEEWRCSMMSAPNDEVEKTIKDAAMFYVKNDYSLKFDPDVQSLKEQLSHAQTPYREAKKISMIRVEFLMETLKGRGIDVPSIADYFNAAKED